MTAASNNGVRVGKAFGVTGFLMLMLVPLAFPYDFLGDGIYNLVVPKMFFLRLAAAAFFISLVFRLAFEPGLVRRFLGNTWPVFAWLGWQAASFIWTDYTWATTEAVIDNACVLACLLGAVIFFTGNKAGRFGEIAFAISATIAGIVFLLAPLNDPSASFPAHAIDVFVKRVLGLAGIVNDRHAPFVNENPGGMFFALAAIAASGRFFSTLAAKRLVSRTGIAITTAFMLFCLACVIKSNSVGATISLTVGAVVLVVVAWRERIIILTAVMIFMLAFLGLMLAAPGLKEEMLGKKYESTTWTRVFFWRGALQMIYERPALGRGAGTFAEANVENQPVESYMHAGIKGPAQYAHNFYLETAVETGAIGLAVFLGVVVFVLHKARQAMARAEAKRWYIAGLVGAACVALAHGGVDIVMSLASTQVFFWLCAAAILGRGIKTEDSTSKTDGLKWIAAGLLSACAVLTWAVVFKGELPREIEFVKLSNAGDLPNYRVNVPYETRISLFVRASKAKALSDIAFDLQESSGGEKSAEAEHLYAEAVSNLRYVQSLAPDMYNTDLNLGYALINQGKINKNNSEIAEGCRMLVRHLRRDPFNIPEKNEPNFKNEEILRALKNNLADPALKRELRDVIANALTLVSEGGEAVPPEVRYSADQLQAYIESLAHDPDLIEHP